MSWLEIVGAVGGSAGVVALIKAGIDIYNARSNRTSVDVQNLKEMLDEAHKMFDEATERVDKLEAKMDADREKSREYIESLRDRIQHLESADRNKEQRLNVLEKVVNVAWRCKYPENVDDCPVIQEYEKRKLCEGCKQEDM